MKRLSLFLFLMLLSLPPAYPMARRPPLPEDVPAAEPEKQVLNLRDAYRLALERSEDLAMRQADIEATWADFLDASGEVIGDMNFQVLHFRQEDQDSGSGGSTGATANAFRATRQTRQFTLSQPLFQGFKTLGAIGAARSQRTWAQEELKRARQLLFLDVVTAFNRILERQAEQTVTRETLELFRERVHELEEWEKIGKSRRSETVTAQARMKRIEADLAREEGLLAAERRVLEFLTGISLQNTELEEDPMAADSTAGKDELLEGVVARPDVVANEAAFRISHSSLIAAQSELWPEISLEGNLYEQREGFQSGIDYDVLFKIDIPLYKGGEAFADIKRALSSRRKAKLTYEKALRQARTEINQAHDGWISLNREHRALEEAVEAARENYRLQKEDYEKNLVDNLDVLDALQTLNDNRLEASRAYYEKRIQYWSLLVAAGQCCESFGIFD